MRELRATGACIVLIVTARTARRYCIKGLVTICQVIAAELSGLITCSRVMASWRRIGLKQVSELVTCTFDAPAWDTQAQISSVCSAQVSLVF